MKKENKTDFIPIPDELLEEFRQRPDEAAEDETGALEEIERLSAIQFKLFVKTGSWLAENADDRLRAAGGSGLGKLPPENFAKLAVIAFEEELAKMSDDAPKALFFTTCASIIMQNAAAIMRTRKKKQKEEKKAEPENE